MQVYNILYKINNGDLSIRFCDMKMLYLIILYTTANVVPTKIPISPSGFTSITDITMFRIASM